MFEVNSSLPVSNMRESEVRPEQLKSLETKFCAFLKDVSFRSHTGSRRNCGPDGLYHTTLRFQDGAVQFEEPNRYGPYFRRGSPKPLSLEGGDEALDSAVAEAQRLCPCVSEKLIKKALRDLMVELFDRQVVSGEVDGELETILDILDTSNIGQELLETIQWLRSLAVPQIVYVPIEGLNLSGSLIIGEVELHHRNGQSELDQMLRIVEEKQGEESTSYTRDALKYAKCYATVKATGDGEFVRNEAIQKVTQALHILNLCLSSSMHQPSWAKIRISSIVINRSSPTENPEDDRLGFLESFPSSRPLELSKSKLLDVIRPIYDRSFSAKPCRQRNWKEGRNMVEKGLEKLLTCFQGNNDIAKRIQRAVTWYSKAVDANTPEGKFVNLAIALESLLIGPERGPYATTGSISQNLAERVAFLLEDDFENRHRKVNETKKLYGRRGATVHSGEKITEEDLSKMDKLVKQVTLTFLKHDFESWLAFQEWMARQKFEKKAPHKEVLLSLCQDPRHRWDWLTRRWSGHVLSPANSGVPADSGIRPLQGDDVV